MVLTAAVQSGTVTVHIYHIGMTKIIQRRSLQHNVISNDGDASSAHFLAQAKKKRRKAKDTELDYG
jgi:hypothetical protein